MDAEVVEIPPPVPRSSASLKQKEKAYVHEIINLDDDDDEPADSVIIQKELNKMKKGKAVMDVSDDHLNGFSEDVIFIQPDDFVGSINGTDPNGLEEGSHTSLNGDGQMYDMPMYDDDDYYMDYIIEDQFDKDYDLLQAHFDSMDIPPGVEAPLPWLAGGSENEKKLYSGNSLHISGSNPAEIAGFAKDPEYFDLTGLPPSKMKATFTNSGSHDQANSAIHPPPVDLLSPLLAAQSVQGKKNRAGSQRKGNSRNFSFGLDSFKNRRLLDHVKNKKSPVPSGNSNKISFSSQLAGFKHAYAFDSSTWDQSLLQGVNKQPLPVSSPFAKVPPPVSGSSSYPSFPQPTLSQSKPSAPDLLYPWVNNPSKYPVNHSHAYPAKYTSYIEPFSPSVYTLPEEERISQLPQSSSGNHASDIEDVLRKFDNFKHFDTVQDHSDHRYTGSGSAVKQPPKNWAKRIQEEWKILEKDLPDTIFVRVYESRMDLLRAVIIGAEGTPYHDGLFFFDVSFPPSYPTTPPQVYYHSRGLRLNPNLYSCGKVCLSLLNTWSGTGNEKWMPGVSTVLQVLVSIQGLILTSDPYFNEPGYEASRGTKNGQKQSLKYSEDTLILSLRTMTYMMKTPPKHFEDFVKGHFFRRAQDILAACKAYTEGAQVGSLVRGGGQGVVAGEKTRSNQFKQCVAGYIGILAKGFMNIGVKDCEKFLTPPPPPPPPAAAKETRRQVGGITMIDPLD